MPDQNNNELHKDHRTRLRSRFRKYGLDGFTDIQVLELLLFFAIPRRDTNPIAHALLDRFGSLDQVFDAPMSELEKVDGIGEQASTLLHLIPQIFRSYGVCEVDKEKVKILNSIDKCGNYLKPFFRGKVDETVYLLCLDAKCKMLGCVEVGRGSVNSAGVPTRKIVETALSFNATSVVLAHNHPSGLAIPSAEDIATTRRVAMALDAVGIYLADHIVVADNEFVSLLDSKLYYPEECRVPV